jgi:peptidoglycan hydrolase-like protein with peptidoglycan-binding domain
MNEKSDAIDTISEVMHHNSVAQSGQAVFIGSFLMRSRWAKTAIFLGVILSVGIAGMTQASALSPKSKIAYNRGDALFCANHLEDIILSKAKGSSGNCVYVMQALMVLDNPSIKKSLPIDGDFGPVTDKAVRAREERLGWKADGLVSAPTFKNLASLGTTPDGAAHITGVVTNAVQKSTKPSSSSGSSSKGSSNGGSGGGKSPAKSAPKQPSTREGTNIPGTKSHTSPYTTGGAAVGDAAKNLGDQLSNGGSRKN